MAKRDKTRLEKDDKPTYEGWLVRVNACLVSQTGLTYEDFPDCDLKLWFDNRISPSQAAERILHNANE